MKKFLILFIAVLAAVTSVDAQCTLIDGEWVSITGGECNNAVITAVPFLRITPDARTGAMGDMGIAISPDANSIHFNGSNLINAEKDFGASLSYTPWLRELGVDDVFLAYLSGYSKIDEFNAVGFALRYFSLGEVQYTDMNGMSIGFGSPNEFEISAAYSRKLSDKLSAGITGKFIFSNLASGQNTPGGEPIESGTSGAADVSFTYKAPMESDGGKSDITVGLAITNIGAKITYVQDLNRDFIPTNLGLGAAWNKHIDDYNKITIGLDINKLLVPSPIHPTDENYDVSPEDGIADYRQKSLFSGMFGSFSDAPNGGKEELQELNFSVGAEYWYNEQFAVRAGYFLEHQNKGNRKYLTAGLGLRLKDFGLNISYLIPTSNQRSPLDNTLRFSLLFDRGAFSDSES